MGFPDAELSVTLTSDAEIADLAGRFGRDARPTDVLAFPTAEGPGAEWRGESVGDVILSLETAERQAAERGGSLDAELTHLLVHGVLHLLGMDHQCGPDTRRMRELEKQMRWEIERGA